MVISQSHSRIVCRLHTEHANALAHLQSSWHSWLCVAAALTVAAGSYFALSLFDRMWHPNLTEDEAIAMMEVRRTGGRGLKSSGLYRHTAFTQHHSIAAAGCGMQQQAIPHTCSSFELKLSCLCCQLECDSGRRLQAIGLHLWLGGWSVFALAFLKN